MFYEQPRPHQRIIRNPGILGGKPIVRGTRIPVALVLGHLSGNPDLDDLFAAYPRLTVDDVKAVLAFARTLVEETSTQEQTSIVSVHG